MFSRIDPGKTSGILSIFLKDFVFANLFIVNVKIEYVNQNNCKD